MAQPAIAAPLRIRPPAFTEGKLDGSNYTLWKFKIMAILDSYELLETVMGPTGTDPEPQPIPDPANPAQVIPADAAALRAWRRRNADALCAIVTSVSDSVLTLVQHTTKACDAWSILSRQYETRNHTRIQNLENQLAAEELGEDEKAEEFIKRIKDLQDQMAAAGVSKTPEDLARRCIRILPPKYDGLVTALNTQIRPQPLTFEELCAMLLEEELRLKSRNKGSADSAFTANTKGKGKATSSQPKKKPQKKKFSGTCFYCQKPGHTVKDCRKKEADEKNGTLRASWKNNAAAHSAEAEIEMWVATEEVSTLAENSSADTWILDSGASRHMTSNKGWYSSWKPLQEPINVVVGNNEKCPAEGSGTVSFVATTGEKKNLADVLYVPQIKRSLLSIASMTDRGLEVRFNKTGAEIIDGGGKVVGRGVRRNNLYELSAFTTTIDNDANKLWHARFGHLSFATLNEMQKKGMVAHLPPIQDWKEPCEACLMGKHQRKAFPQESHNRSKAPLELVHADLCGKMSCPAMGGSSYFFLLVDDYSRKMWVYFLREKAEAFGKFKMWHKLVETETGKKVKKFRTDRGGEFLSTEFNDYCKEYGIQRQLTTAHTPQQNGVVERRNRTVVEMARCMLKAQDLPDSFWAEAVNTAVYILNRSFTKAVIDKTPLEAFSGKKPSVMHFRIFGCKCYAHVPDSTRTKLESKSRKCIFVGYSDESKAYRLYDSEAKKIIVSRDVVFSEQPHTVDKGKSTFSDEEVTHHVPSLSQENQVHDSSDEDDQQQPVVVSPGKPLPRWTQQLFDERNPGFEIPETSADGPRRSKRIEEQRRAATHIVNMALMAEIVGSAKEPTSLKEALSNPQWRAAMQTEYDSIMKNDTWQLVDRPPKRKVIGTKWVYKVKYKADGSLEKYKARLVAQGFSQVEGFDVHETFAPTARMTSIRVVLAVATHNKWKLFQMDVKSAFLNGELKEEVYVSQPPGFEDPNAENKVCKLAKALYGLKQAPRAWYCGIDDFLKSIGFSKSSSDANVYVLTKDNYIVIIILYVDDLIITGNDEIQIQLTQNQLKSEFEMTDLGLMHFCLGIEVWQQAGNTFISQKKYALEILKAFGMADCKAISTPMEINSKISLEDSTPLVDAYQYRKLVGSLMFLTNTRLDISFAVGVISRFSQKPRESHWQAGMRILRYIKGTIEYGITYGAGNTLTGFCDSDWAGDCDSRKSVSGYCFTLGSGAISWSSKKQPTVALSSTEAEYKAACFAACEAVWLRRILAHLGVQVNGASVIQCDNQSCIAIAKNPVFHARTKHIEIQYHYVRELIEDEVVEFEYCPSLENRADIFTKPLPNNLHHPHLHHLGIGPRLA